MMNKVQSWNVITLFGILIFGFTAATLIKPDTEYSEAENRTLAQMPKASLTTVLNGEFEADYETYLTDQFLARDGWIGLKTAVERAALKRESKGIYFAEDDYLIEKHSGAYTSDTSSSNAAILQQFADKYSDQFPDTHMSVMIVPNAVDILTDKLPPLASESGAVAYLEQVSAGLPEQVWVDAASVMEAHRDEMIYYRTDHHWTTKAAFYAYQAWAQSRGLPVPQESDFRIETVTDSFEGTIQAKLGIKTRQDSIELYEWKDDPFYTVWKNDDKEAAYSVYDRMALDTKSKYDVFFGGNDAKVTIRTRAESGRRILVIKDSYAHCFVPFLLRDFDEITMLDIRYYNQKLSDLIAQGDYTDLLFLYNASGFAEEAGINRILY